MKLNAIITLASRGVELQFRAMERSLRATGCKLPLLVIPYDDEPITLPAGAQELRSERLFQWVAKSCSHPMMRKYLSLTQSHYQYVDADVVFLRNPESVLSELDGFVTCCTEWNKPMWTVTEESQARFQRKSSTWQKEIFCAGQYASDSALYDVGSLISTAEKAENRDACMNFQLHDQPGTNALVIESGCRPLNLTLPPFNMESTWAGDYPGGYEHLWTDERRKPYIIHWAGPVLEWDLPINALFYQFLTNDEQKQWASQQTAKRTANRRSARWPFGVRMLNALVRTLYPRYYVQPRPQAR